MKNYFPPPVVVAAAARQKKHGSPDGSGTYTKIFRVTKFRRGRPYVDTFESYQQTWNPSRVLSAASHSIISSPNQTVERG
mmetsp:Transcript_14617/g.32231  ORF Transcript_14617/g.32231 Transcript_14617/m.32231 type:complete len:80 (-) Transcript_14617:7067-7306(-)